MFNVEQFIYTTSTIENKKGYQIVAKSEGITENIITELNSYIYPMDIDPSKFNESRSFLLLKDDLVAYSRIKNIGTGYDGRENTLYNHTFVFSKVGFEKYNYDSRIFDKFYLEDKFARGILPTLSIDPPLQPFPLIINEFTSVLEKILFSLFMNKKIALLIDDVELPQKILAFLPKSMRLISFSTYVVEPKKQSKYDFILNPSLKKSKLKKDFELIFPSAEEFPHKTEYEKSISYYAQLIKSKKHEELMKLHNVFEKTPGKSNKNKLILLSNYFQFQSATDDKKRTQYAEKTLESVKQFDQNTFSFYFKKIKNSLEIYKKIMNILQPEIDPLMSVLEAIIYSPTKIKEGVSDELGGKN